MNQFEKDLESMIKQSNRLLFKFDLFDNSAKKYKEEYEKLFNLIKKMVLKYPKFDMIKNFKMDLEKGITFYSNKTLYLIDDNVLKSYIKKLEKRFEYKKYDREGTMYI